MKNKVNWKRLSITIGIVLFTSLVVGGTTWYFMDKYADEDKQSLQNQINTLNTKTESEDEVSEEVVEESEEDSEESCDQEVPIAYERAGLFSESEKSNIVKKIVEPYIYYRNNIVSLENDGLKLASVTVEKYPEDEIDTYWYSVSSVSMNGGSEGWVDGADGVIDYWKPECMVACQFTQDFIDKYPNNVPEDYELIN